MTNEFDTPKDKLIDELMEVVLANCRDDATWNDNTIYDALRFGTKGYEDYTIEELEEELTRMKNWNNPQ